MTSGVICGCFQVESRRCRCPNELPSLPSRPGDFHPEPLTDPDVILSHHPALCHRTRRRFPLKIGFLPLPVDPTKWRRPLLLMNIRPRSSLTTTKQSAPSRRVGTFGLAVGAACTFSLGIAGQVLTFRTRAWLNFAPSTCRMPLGQYQGISRARPGGWVNPRFRHRLIRFRHFTDGSLALASLNLACRDHRPDVSTTLTTIAFDDSSRGVRPAPDRRPRRALLHLAIVLRTAVWTAMLVTQAE